MSQQISSDQAPASPGRSPGSITAQSMLDLRWYTWWKHCLQAIWLSPIN